IDSPYPLGACEERCMPGYPCKTRRSHGAGRRSLSRSAPGYAVRGTPGWLTRHGLLALGASIALLVLSGCGSRRESAGPIPATPTVPPRLTTPSAPTQKRPTPAQESTSTLSTATTTPTPTTPSP